MKLQSQKAAFICLILTSVVLFIGVNLCMGTTQTADQNSTSMISVSQDLLKFPEMEVVIKVCKLVLAFIIP